MPCMTDPLSTLTLIAAFLPPKKRYLQYNYYNYPLSHPCICRDNKYPIIFFQASICLPKILLSVLLLFSISFQVNCMVSALTSWLLFFFLKKDVLKSVTYNQVLIYFVHLNLCLASRKCLISLTSAFYLTFVRFLWMFNRLKGMHFSSLRRANLSGKK